MKKITCLSAIACIALTSCREEPGDSGNQTIGVNPVVVPGGNISDVNQQKQSQSNFGGNFSSDIPHENSDPTPNKSKVKELRDKIENFKHVDNKNWFEFKQTIEDFEEISRQQVSGKAATIQDDKLTFKILDIQGTIDLKLNKNFLQQQQFEANIDAIQFLNDRGGQLEFPLNINTFPSKLEVFSNSFGSNLNKIRKLNDNNYNKKFSVEKGVVQLEGEVFLNLDSLDNFYALTGALTQRSNLCFFDDTFFKNPITWEPNGKISFYGGEQNCVLFEKWNGKVSFTQLNNVLEDLVPMQNVGIKIDKIKIEQTNSSIKLGGCELDEDIWTDYDFWICLNRYHELFNFGDGIRIKEENDGFIINNKPIKIVQHLIKNVKHHKEDFISKQIFKLERANL